MELTSVQRRALTDLLTVREGWAFPSDLPSRLRERIDDAVGDLPDDVGAIRLAKERLNDLARCQGLFDSGMAGERPFEYGPGAARGTLLHKVIELEVGSRQEVAPHELAETAAGRLDDDRRFAPFWHRLDPAGRDELLMASAKTLDDFRGSFPPLRLLRRRLVPISELWMEAPLCSGRVTIVGKVDLAFGQRDPRRASRVLIDLKTGGAWPEHPEDMRLYALLHTLKFGVPPHRVATLFLRSGEWQAEDVTEDSLLHAADRVAGAVRTAAGLRLGEPAHLKPGPYCSWCPRRLRCPAAAAAGLA